MIDKFSKNKLATPSKNKNSKTMTDDINNILRKYRIRKKLGLVIRKSFLAKSLRICGKHSLKLYSEYTSKNAVFAEGSTKASFNCGDCLSKP